MKIKKIFACTLGLLLAASCSNETPVGDGSDSLFGDVPEGMFEYRFTIQGITPTRLSYADVPMEEAEMKLHNAKVLVFAQATAGTLAATDKLVCVKDAEIVKGKSRFMIDKDTNFPAGTAKVAVLQIANIENSNLEALTLTDGTTTYKDVMDKLESKGDAGANIENVGLLQIGRVLDCALPAGGKLAVGKMTIKRPFARFDVRNSGMKALTITKLAVKDISNKFLVLTDDKFPADAVHNHKKEVVVPKGLNRPEDGSKPDAAMLAKFVPGVLYSYPGSVAGADSPVLLVTGKLVTGAGKEKELKDYEVPFAKGDTKLRIKTNTRYTLTLKAELDGIVVDISESFAEWGSEEDAAITYELDLDKYASVSRVDEGLKLTGITQDRTFKFEGQGRENYNFSVEGVPEGTTVTATAVDTKEDQPVEIVESYGALTHYNVKLTDKVQIVLDKPQLIDIVGKSKEDETIFHIQINYLKGLVKYPMPDGVTYLPAVYDERIGMWWAPVNVGAKDITDSGRLFQYGRNNGGWANAEEAMKNVSYTEVDISNNYDFNNKEDKNWYVGRQNGSISPDAWFVSSTEYIELMRFIWEKADGVSNPCPKGWMPSPLHAFEKMFDRSPSLPLYIGDDFVGCYTIFNNGEKLRFQTKGGYVHRSAWGDELITKTDRALYLEAGMSAFGAPLYFSHEFGAASPLKRQVKRSDHRLTTTGFIRCVFDGRPI